MKYLVLSIKIFFIIFSLYTLYYILNTPVLAQQVSLSISPPLLEVLIKPGKSIMVAYNLVNSDDPVNINVKMASFEPKDNIGNVRIKDQIEGPIRFNLDNSDIELNTPFFLKSSSTQQLLLRIRVPENIKNGDYYYTLLAETVPSASIEGIGSAQAKATIGANILITVTDSGVVEVKPSVTLFSTRGGLAFGQDLKIFDSFDNIPVVLIIENKGKNLIKPQGEITLRGSFGLTSKYDIVSKNILSESQRLVEATPSADINCKGQACLTPASLVVSGFFVGLYHLSANIGFGENSPQIFATTSFFAFPFKLLFGLIIVIIGTIYIIKRFFSDQ